MSYKLFECVRKGNSDRQLIIFPYLGGSVSTLSELMRAVDSPETEIWAANPPGHIGSQLPLSHDMNQLTDLYYTELKEIVKPECYLFGHSMGGNIAYYMAKKWEIFGLKRDWLKGVVIAASAPPCFMYHKKYSELSDSALIDQIMAYKALPADVIKSEELMQMLLPVFRADYRVMETGAEIEIGEKLAVDSYFIWGDEDPVEPVELLTKWNQYFAQPGTVLPVKHAEHMLVHHNIDAVAGYLRNILNGKYRRKAEEF